MSLVSAKGPVKAKASDIVAGFWRSLSRFAGVGSLSKPLINPTLTTSSWGVAHTWLRRWCYRMFLHRASFLAEGVLLRLLDPCVQVQYVRTCPLFAGGGVFSSFKLREIEWIFWQWMAIANFTRTCGVPFAELLPSPHVNKLLLRGCSKPSAKDTLCRKHAADPCCQCMRRSGAIAPRRLCIVLGMFGCWRSKCLVTVPGNQLAPSRKPP